MPRNSVAYDEDFYAWTMEQARLLRSVELSRLEIENIAEERWSGTVREQRSRFEDLLNQSPSLRRVVVQIRPALYVRARRVASNETGLRNRMFPARCPFTAEQILSEEFLPE